MSNAVLFRCMSCVRRGCSPTGKGEGEVEGQQVGVGWVGCVGRGVCEGGGGGGGGETFSNDCALKIESEREFYQDEKARRRGP